VRVRRAIAQAINVPYFIENFLYGQGKAATGPIPSSSIAFYPVGSTPPYPFDRKASENLLDPGRLPTPRWRHTLPIEAGADQQRGRRAAACDIHPAVAWLGGHPGGDRAARCRRRADDGHAAFRSAYRFSIDWFNAVNSVKRHNKPSAVITLQAISVCYGRRPGRIPIGAWQLMLPAGVPVRAMQPSVRAPE